MPASVVMPLVVHSHTQCSYGVVAASKLGGGSMVDAGHLMLLCDIVCLILGPKWLKMSRCG